MRKSRKRWVCYWIGGGKITQIYSQNEYREKGDYHRNLSKDWSYYPLYLSKKAYVFKLMETLKSQGAILDIGCGEGVFVEELRKKGFSIEGVDAHYSSDSVTKGDVLDLPFPPHHFEVVLFLDVIEHLNLTDHRLAFREISRVLKPEGTLIMSVPNLAHLYSRIEFLLKGKLIRTAAPAEKHPGDRPIREYIQLLKEEGYEIRLRKGFFLTLPFCFKWIQRKPRNFMWLYHFLNHFAVPNWCFLNVLLCRRINNPYPGDSVCAG